MKKVKKLSLRGKIGFIPSLLITVPILCSIVVIGSIIFVIAKVFAFCGILEALEYQYKKFKAARIKKNLIK